MPKFYNQTNEELEAPPPSYQQMTKMVSDRVKRRVKNTIMPKVRAKVAALGKAKVAEKKAQAKKITKAAGKMEGRVKEKKRVKEGKKQIIKGIKKIGAKELAKKKAAGARIKTKASVAAKMPRIKAKVAALGKAKVKEKKKVGKNIKKVVKQRNKAFDKIRETPQYEQNTGFEGALGRFASKRRRAQGLRYQDKSAIDYASGGDYPTESIFIDSLTDTVINPESGNVVGTMYGGVFRHNVKLDSAYQTEMERRAALPRGASSAAFADDDTDDEPSVDIDDDTDSTDSDTEDVNEINLDLSTGRFGGIDGKLYFITDDGRIYDPDTSERVPQAEEDFEGEWRSAGFLSASMAIATKSFLRTLQS
tara:strand:+ start:155 stop:1243 length:1089 start_codon:yes stop_codon:yes gene_type:complete